MITNIKQKDKRMRTLNILTGASSEIGTKLKKHIDADYNVVLYNNSFKGYEDSYLINCNLNDYDAYDTIGTELVEICNKVAPQCINLIHMAGILVKHDLRDKLNYRDWEKMFRVNCFSFYWLAKIVSNIIAERKSVETGCFVAVSSNLTYRVNHNNAGYIASKAALEGIVKQLAYDCGDRGIRCNAIAPGYFRSNMSGDSYKEIESIIKNNTPLHRVGMADEISSVIEFILSSKASWVNGQVIIVDGGNTIGF